MNNIGFQVRSSVSNGPCGACHTATCNITLNCQTYLAEAREPESLAGNWAAEVTNWQDMQLSFRFNISDALQNQMLLIFSLLK
jgi:hypothetical protein